MASQMNWEGSGKAVRRAADPHAANISSGGGNWVGGDTGRKKADYDRKAQVNFDETISIPHKMDPGQGQKSGTGCNDGY